MNGTCRPIVTRCLLAAASCREMGFYPEAREWVSRARFWRENPDLSPVTRYLLAA